MTEQTVLPDLCEPTTSEFQATLSGPALPAPLILDDADLGLGLTDQERLMAALQRLTDTGITVVASTIVTEAVTATAQTFLMSPPA